MFRTDEQGLTNLEILEKFLDISSDKLFKLFNICLC